jgi:hypothetical protein
VDRVRSALGALPQEIRFIARRDSAPVVLESIAEASAFLASPRFDFPDSAESFVYQITYTDGSEFERAGLSLDGLKELHRQMERLADHISSLQATTPPSPA